MTTDIPPQAARAVLHRLGVDDAAPPDAATLRVLQVLLEAGPGRRAELAATEDGIGRLRAIAGGGR